MLFGEIDAITARGVDCSRLVVTANAHVITAYHVLMDKVGERFLGKSKIGTTGRGIGPAYADKMSRLGIRVQDLFDEKILRQKVEGALESKNQILVKVYNRRAISVDEVVDELLTHAERLRPMVADTSLLLERALDAGKVVLLEAGQATMLDVDHGTYPFVTSSNATAGGACTGSGIPPTRIDRVMRSSRRTRPGSARDRSRPSCSTTMVSGCARSAPSSGSRPAGPVDAAGIDAVVARYAARVNGVTDFVLTKLDVLTGLAQVPVCVAYDVDGVRHDEMPMTQTEFHHAVPIYELLPGWDEDISGARVLEDLPKAARAYVEAIEAISGAPVSVVGVGADREETIAITVAGVTPVTRQVASPPCGSWSSVEVVASTRCASRSLATRTSPRCSARRATPASPRSPLSLPLDVGRSTWRRGRRGRPRRRRARGAARRRGRR